MLIVGGKVKRWEAVDGGLPDKVDSIYQDYFAEWGLKTGLAQYEIGKQEIWKLNLSASEHAEAIRQLRKWCEV